MITSKTLAAAPRVPGTAEHAQARAYIESQLRSFGHATHVDCVPRRLQRAHEGLRPRLVVGAHYDSVPGSPGADDNASGVAAMLEVARAAIEPAVPRCRWSSSPTTRKRWGSPEAARTAIASKRERDDVAGMMSLEMLGFTGDDQVFVPGVETSRTKGDFLAMVANHESAHLLEMFDELVTSLPLELVVAASDSEAGALSSLSDHGSFWDAGYPALIVTDTAFLRNPHYHRASDRPGTLNYEFLTLSTEAVVAALRRFRRDAGR